MAQQDAADFLDKVENDSKLKNSLAALGSTATVEDVLDFAAASGYNFTSDELVAAGKVRAESLSETAGGELSDDALEAVAGGASKSFTLYITRDSIKVTTY